MLLRFSVKLFFVTLSALLIASPVNAENTQIGGFIGFGHSYASHNNFLGDGISNHEIVELGVNIRHDFSENLSFSGQVGYRRLGKAAIDNSIRVDYASLDYTTRQLMWGEQTFSLGRIKSLNGLYNASRDIPMGRPSIFLSQGVYTDVFRNMMMSIDGIKISSVHDFEHGLLSIDAGAGQLNIDDNFMRVTLGEGSKGDWSSNSAYIADIRYVTNNMTFGASYNSGNTSYHSEPGSLVSISPFLPPLEVFDGTVSIKSYTAFAQYYLGRFELTTEYVYRKTDFAGFIPFINFPRNLSQGYYAQVKYFASPSLSLLARVDKFDKSLNADQAQDDIVFASLPPLPNWAGLGTTQSLSLNWQISAQWSMTTDLHLVSGSGWLPPFGFSSAASLKSKRWKLAAIQAVYRF